MGASTRDIFGTANAATAATPGSYGQAPRGYRLPADTKLGAVRLQISSLERSLPFYERTLGFNVLTRERSRVTLAAHGSRTPLIELNENPNAAPVPRRGRLGLYHFAILVPDRATLGRFIQHLSDTGAQAGAADHLVSEALYLQDPDNLGIEVYADRPRDTWKRVGLELMMATDPLDLAGLVRAANGTPWMGMPAGTVMGHVHLHVGDIAKASEFFSDAMGFDRMVWHYPGALFLAAGGYHHHLGTNIWAGSSAQPAGENEARLLEWTVVLPNAADVQAVAKSIESAGFATERDDADIIARDPWGTHVRITPAARANG